MTSIRLDILKVLEALSGLYPDMRFGQLVVNLSNLATRRPDAVYDVVDDQFLIAAQELLAKRVDRVPGDANEVVVAAQTS